MNSRRYNSIFRIVILTISLLLIGMVFYTPFLVAALSEDIYCTVIITQIPPPPANFLGTALSTTTVQWSWDNVANEDGYRIYTSTDGFKVEVSTDMTNWPEGGLNPNTQYGRYVKSFNGFGESASSNPDTRYTLANSPTGLSSPNSTQTSISLSWTAGTGGNTRYAVERAPDNSGVPGTWAFIRTWPDNITTPNFTDNGLNNNTTYWYRICGYNGDSIITSAGNIVSQTTLPFIDTLLPREPSGLRGTLSPNRSSITLNWHAVTQNIDGTPCTDVAGYNIYRNDNVHLDNWAQVNGPLVTELSWTDATINGQVFYYTVKAEDSSNNESTNATMIVDSTPNTNIIALATDFYTRILTPQTINSPLFRETNNYNDDLVLTITQPQITINDDTICSFLFAANTYTDNQIINCVFPVPEADIILRYPTSNGFISGTDIFAAQADERLVVSWHNGVEWINIEGTVDTDNQTISVKSKYLGYYNIIQKLRFTKFTLTKVYPRIFSPNNDGINDVTNFVFENPNNELVTGKIYDLGGSFVADMLPGEITNSLCWNGKFNNGRKARSGVYVYQLKVNGKAINGTVVVAR